MTTKIDKVTIEIPAPPEGYEAVWPGMAQDGDFAYLAVGAGEFKWRQVNVGTYPVLARPRQSPATWANAQPVLSLVAKMCSGFLKLRIRGNHDFYDASDDSAWLHAEPCPPEFDGKTIKPKNGKWVDG